VQSVCTSSSRKSHKSFAAARARRAAFLGLLGEAAVNSVIPEKTCGLQPPVYGEVIINKPFRMVLGSFVNQIAASHQKHIRGRQIYHDARLRRRDVMSQRSRSFFTHVNKVAAIITALGFLFWLCLSVSKHHAPGASYPYYDTQKPVPPWSEPLPLGGNYDRGRH
jgi:hypothetical protein